MERTKKLSLWEQLKIACLKPKEYVKLLEVGKGKVICFFLIITFVLTFLGYGVDMLGFNASVGGLKNFFLNRLPVFELRDGQLQVETPLDFYIGTVHIVADTSKDTVSKKDLKKNDVQEIFFVKKEVAVKNNVGQTVLYKVPFSLEKGIVLNNTGLVKMIPLFHMMALIVFFAEWVAVSVVYLVFCGFISIFLFVNMKIQDPSIRLGKIFKLSIYARVIFELIETIGKTAGYSFFSGLIWLLISYLGSYQLLGMAFQKPKEKKES